MTTELETKDLWLDANQGDDVNGNAFGYIGTNEETTDDDGEDCDFCGWFFTWPGSKAKVTTEAEVEQVVESLETDETARAFPEIPHRLAEQKLRAMLARNLARNAVEIEE